MASREERINRIKEKIGCIPDFPKPGIMFRDIFPLMRYPEVTKDCVSLLAETVRQRYGMVEVVVGLEARGFIFGPMLAQQLEAAFVPIRKKGKLPGDVVSVEYKLEYGTDTFEAQKNAVSQGQSVVIVDDLIATGGTMDAAVKLLNSMGAKVKAGLVVIELVDLKGRDKVTVPLDSLIEYEGE